MERFKLVLAGEGPGVLSNRKQPGAADVLGSDRETPVKCLKTIPLKS